MARIVRPVLAWALLAAAWSHAAIAGDVLRYVPADALGFIVIHDLEATNDKIVAILKVFERIEGHSIVDPLRLIKAASGLADDGLDAHGDALFALLATGEELEAAAQAYRPMLLTPVSDYAALAASLNADPTGAISRVTIVGQSVHIAQWGQFALLMDEQHRPTMEALLAGGEPEMLPQVAALAEWIGRHDVAAALLPAGVTAMTAIARAEVAAARGEASRQPADEAFAEELAQMEAGLDMYEGILAYLDEQVESTVVGIAIDDQLNIVARNQLLFHAPSDAAAPIVGSVGKPGALDRHRDEPFVFAAGGPVLPLWDAAFSRWSRDLVQSHPGIYGFEEFNETQWAQFEEVSKAWLDVRSLSAAMLVGSDKDPLYSNFYLIAEVDDAPAYVAALRRSMQLWNDLVASSSSEIKLQYEVEEIQIAGRPAMRMTTDVMAAAGDPNVPMVQSLMKALIGDDGKLRFFIIELDAQTVITAICTDDRIEQAVQAAHDGKAGMSERSDVLQTAALLADDALWVGYVSPAGWVAWISRMINSAFGQIGVGFQLPEYPAGPPLGFSAATPPGAFQGEVVVPAQALRDLAAFIEKLPF